MKRDRARIDPVVAADVDSAAVVIVVDMAAIVVVVGIAVGVVARDVAASLAGNNNLRWVLIR